MTAVGFRCSYLLRGMTRRLVVAIPLGVFAIVGLRVVEHTGAHKFATPSTNDHITALANWSKAACDKFRSIAQVTDCNYSAAGTAGSYVTVTLAMDSEDAVLLCPAFARALPYPINKFEMRIKLAATGGLGAVCNQM
jgi:hypothetical protein